MLITNRYGWLYTNVVIGRIDRRNIPSTISTCSSYIAYSIMGFLIGQRDTLATILLPSLVVIANRREVDVILDNAIKAGSLTYHIKAFTADMLQIEHASRVMRDVLPNRTGSHSATIRTGRSEVNTSTMIVGKRHISTGRNILHTVVASTTQLRLSTEHGSTTQEEQKQSFLHSNTV